MLYFKSRGEPLLLHYYLGGIFMANFEKYRKKKNTVKANLEDEVFNNFLKYLKENNLTQQSFIENKIKEILKK